MLASTSTPLLSQHLLKLNLHSRRLLLHSPLYESPPHAATAPPTSDPSDPYSRGGNGFDANVVMVLSVLLCALICSLGLNSIIRCALRCSILVSAESNNANPSARVAKTGIKKKALKRFPMVNYSPGLNLPGLAGECVICLSEFSTGEKVKILPKCNHGFHVKCIDKWLNSHSSCPTCRHCLIETCQKIVGCEQASSSQPAREVTINMAPLEREDLVRNYRGNS